MKKVWTPAMRAAFAKKMAKYRGKGKRRARRKNPKCTCGNQACKIRMDRGLMPFCQMSAPKKSCREGRPMRAGSQATGAMRGRYRSKNPTKAEVKAAAKSIAKKAAALAWAGTKRTARFGGRVAGAGAKAAAAEVKASICRTRAKNPKKKGFQVRVGSARKRKLVWTAMTRADAIHVAKVYAKAYPRKVVSVHAEK